MTAILKGIAEDRRFQNFITAVILLAGVVVGLETYPPLVEHIEGLLHVLDIAILAIFVAEVVIKMGAEGRRPWRYFHDREVKDVPWILE
ncbi:MAG: ion transporter, partial [Myxococcota bacterium]